MTALQNPHTLRVEQIQYLPHHRCPRCNATARTTESGAWLQPYLDWFGSALRYWQDHLGYVYFRCDCRHHPEFGGSLRVARLGDAILPIHFVDAAAAAQNGKRPADINAELTRQAVAFLAAHADPAFTGNADFLTHTLYALVSGGLSPESARREIQAWMDGQIQTAIESAQIGVPIGEFADVHLPD